METTNPTFIDSVLTTALESDICVTINGKQYALPADVVNSIFSERALQAELRQALHELVEYAICEDPFTVNMAEHAEEFERQLSIRYADLTKADLQELVHKFHVYNDGERTEESAWQHAISAFCQDYVNSHAQPSETPKQHYTVSIAVDGRIDIDVNAASPKEAKALAMDAFLDADLGDLEVVDANAVNATDENNNLIDF